MSCTSKKYIINEILVNSDTGLVGPAGPQGPAGPPGPVPDEYPADQTTVTNPGYNNVQEVIDDLLYVMVDITAFSGGTSLFELGRQLTAITFNWTINKDVITQTLTGPPEMTPVTLNATQRSVTVVLANLDSNASFELTVDDGKNITAQQWSVSFENKNYYGDAIIPGAIDSTFILSLNGVIRSSQSYNYTSNATGSEYNWYCIPSRYSTPTFYADGFEGGFQFVQTVSFTNAYGYTENYDVYRSDNPDIGPNLNIVVI